MVYSLVKGEVTWALANLKQSPGSGDSSSNILHYNFFTKINNMKKKNRGGGGDPLALERHPLTRSLTIIFFAMDVF
ncbi:hypothetical protein HanPI659440_Chr04g0167611 [Helianthus annuus]|nr:hypothetical protein HanPI659440_Chr04g0167611 [Helianthus annuus]